MTTRPEFPPEALLADYPDSIIDLAEQLRLIVRAAVPDAIEAVRPGWRVIGYDVPVGRRTPFFAWIMVQLDHVHLGFPQGVLLADPVELLEGAGITKRARWLTVGSGEPVDTRRLRGYVRDAARMAGLSRSGRAPSSSSRRPGRLDRSPAFERNSLQVSAIRGQNLR